MNTKFQAILTKEEMERIKDKVAEDGTEKITVDLHKLTTKQAKRLINNVITMSRDTCEVRLIHGFNHGTAIKTMISRDIHNPRIKRRFQAPNNPGLTTLCLASA